jgi:hypothetical protein
LLTGRGAFVGDLGFPHQLHMRVVRSLYSHALLRSVERHRLMVQRVIKIAEITPGSTRELLLCRAGVHAHPLTCSLPRSASSRLPRGQRDPRLFRAPPHR